ncbi:3-isopropylmalate dehydratase small subunit [bacterium]|nr:3-isopropylmalate dehydratase small subunit [bacterium]
MKLSGKAFVFGDNIDTDMIIPARYCSSYNMEDLAPHSMEGHPEWKDGSFNSMVAEGDFVVAGENFGCGSSREAAPIALRGAGIGLIIARSFARIFYRNAINIGLPILIASEIVKSSSEGDVLEANLSSGIIQNLTQNVEEAAEPFPPFIQGIIEAGGLLPWIAVQKKSGQL